MATSVTPRFASCNPPSSQKYGGATKLRGASSSRLATKKTTVAGSTTLNKCAGPPNPCASPISVKRKLCAPTGSLCKNPCRHAADGFWGNLVTYDNTKPVV